MRRVDRREKIVVRSITMVDWLGLEVLGSMVSWSSYIARDRYEMGWNDIYSVPLY